MRPDLRAASDLEQAAYVLLRVDGWRTVYGRSRTPMLLEVAKLVGISWRRVIALHDVAVHHGLAVETDCGWLPTADGREEIGRQAQPIEGELVLFEHGASRSCGVCHDPIDHLRAHAEVCRKPACRRTWTRRQVDDQPATRADLEALDRVLAREGHGCPLPPLSPEIVRAHVAATARRTDELDPEEQAALDQLDATALRPRRSATTTNPRRP